MKKKILAITLSLCLVAASAFAGFGDSGAFGAMGNYLKRVGTNILPAVTATYNLGSASKTWNTIYAAAMTVTSFVVSGSIDWSGGNVIYVPLAGSIEAYHDAATAGDTLILSSGNYVVTDDIDITKAINIVGQGVGKTTISCATASKNVFDISASNVRIANLSISITGNSSYGIVTPENATPLTGLVIENVEFTGATGSALQPCRIQDCSATVRNIRINNAGTGASDGLYLARLGALSAVTIDVYNSDFYATEYATVSTGANLSSNYYNCKFKNSGAGYDILENSSVATTVYDCVLNGTTSGTITYAGTVVSGALGVGGANTTGNIATFTQNSDTIGLLHDGTDAYMKWSDGDLYLTTDEGTNADSKIYIKGKGTGFAQLLFWDNSNATYQSFFRQEDAAFSLYFGTNTTSYTINESGRDVNFTVESDTIANAFTVDGGTGAVGIGALNGASLNTISISELVTIPIGSGLDPVVTTVGNLAPAGSIITGAAFRVTQAPGGGATTLDIGITGGDLDLLIDGASCDGLGETGESHTNGAAEWTGIIRNIAATTLTLTTDADVTDTDMIVRVTVWYQTITAPTS